MPCSGFSAIQVSTALPKPYQPGSISRHCAHENTQGIARRSSIAWVFFREAGREPMLRLAISVMTVEAQIGLVGGRRQFLHCLEESWVRRGTLVLQERGFESRRGERLQIASPNL